MTDIEGVDDGISVSRMVGLMLGLSLIVVLGLVDGVSSRNGWVLGVPLGSWEGDPDGT